MGTNRTYVKPTPVKFNPVKPANLFEQTINTPTGSNHPDDSQSTQHTSNNISYIQTNNIPYEDSDEDDELIFGNGTFGSDDGYSSDSSFSTSTDNGSDEFTENESNRESNYSWEFDFGFDDPNVNTAANAVVASATAPILNRINKVSKDAAKKVITKENIIKAGKGILVGAALGASGNVGIRIAKDMYKGKTFDESTSSQNHEKLKDEAIEGAIVGRGCGLGHVVMTAALGYTAMNATLIAGGTYGAYHVVKAVVEN